MGWFLAVVSIVGLSLGVFAGADPQLRRTPLSLLIFTPFVALPLYLSGVMRKERQEDAARAQQYQQQQQTSRNTLAESQAER